MAERVRAFGPGRVNLIGEHTDYNGGLALPFAIASGVTVLADALEEPRIEAHALDLGEEDSFEISQPAGRKGWCAFVRGAVGELAEAGVKLRGARLEISSDVPQGAGLSSSAALEVALVLALIRLADAEPPERRELAKLCSRIENDWVGANTGLLDQLAALFGESARALRIDFSSLDVRLVPLELDGHALVTLDSNQRREECARACELLGVATLSEATLEQARSLPEPLDRRAVHVVSENARVDETVAALAQGDLAAVGELLDASHASLRDLYEVSTPAVEATVARLQEAGALGARIVGGGFGGHVLALMPPGAQAPAGAREVRPGDGGRLLD
jgi:galactokinase